MGPEGVDMPGVIHHLDAETLELFASKGLNIGGSPLGAGEANAAKVRRVMQVTADIARAPMSQLRILDHRRPERDLQRRGAATGVEPVAFLNVLGDGVVGGLDLHRFEIKTFKLRLQTAKQAR